MRPQLHMNRCHKNALLHVFVINVFQMSSKYNNLHKILWMTFSIHNKHNSRNRIEQNVGGFSVWAIHKNLLNLNIAY